MPTTLGYEAKFVKCPFYRNHKSNRIICEGICEGNTINLAFEDDRDRKYYMNIKCNSIDGCRSCIIYQSLDKLYE